ncbi:MAG: hypothetical protein M3O70_01000 [Actinomycetota bacterium]|nr:hypothetical protein [Actinomycetota bacterium]
MRAIVHDAYGTADLLELRDIHRPTIGEDEGYWSGFPKAMRKWHQRPAPCLHRSSLTGGVCQMKMVRYVGRGVIFEPREFGRRMLSPQP